MTSFRIPPEPEDRDENSGVQHYHFPRSFLFFERYNVQAGSKTGWLHTDTAYGSCPPRAQSGLALRAVLAAAGPRRLRRPPVGLRCHSAFTGHLATRSTPRTHAESRSGTQKRCPSHVQSLTREAEPEQLDCKTTFDGSISKLPDHSRGSRSQSLKPPQI